MGHNLGIHLNFNWVLYSVPLQHVSLCDGNVCNFSQHVFYLSLAWLGVEAVIPVIWISRNKKMKDEVKTILGII